MFSSSKKDAFLHYPQQQEHVRLLKRNHNHNNKRSTVVVGGVTLLLGLTAAVLVWSAVATLRLAAVAPKTPPQSGGGGISSNNDNSHSQVRTGQSSSTTGGRIGGGSITTTTTITIPPVRTAQDMDVVFRAYHQNDNEAHRVMATFWGTRSCQKKKRSIKTAAAAAAAVSECLLILPVDAATTSTSAADPPQQRLLWGSGLDEIALQTWKGRKGAIGVDANQDRSVMMLFDARQFGGPASLIALADGHGTAGHVFAEEVIKDLPLRLLQALEDANDRLDDDTTVRQVLKRTFLETDRMLIDEIDQEGGSTIVLVLHLGDKLYLASAGDSTAAVLEWSSSGAGGTKKAKVLQTAVRHKPMDPEERKRIEAAGGTVFQQFGDPSSRVVIPSSRGPMFDSALAMSRCMGDGEGKALGYLLAEPSVLTVDLAAHAGKQLFTIVSSDGVTDMFGLQPLSNKLGSAIFEETNNALALETAVDASLQQSSSVWLAGGQGYRDDMTLLVAKVAMPTR